MSLVHSTSRGCHFIDVATFADRGRTVKSEENSPSLGHQPCAGPCQAVTRVFITSAPAYSHAAGSAMTQVRRSCARAFECTLGRDLECRVWPWLVIGWRGRAFLGARERKPVPPAPRLAARHKARS